MSNDAQSSVRTSEKRTPIYRRRYIVDEPFQYRLIGILCAIWLANSLFFSVVLYFASEWHLKRFYDLIPRAGMLPLLTLPALFAIAITFIVVFGVILLGIVGLYMSNQIAGPLYRTKQCLGRVGRGDWSFELHFRQSDFLRDLPPIFNAMLLALRHRALAEVEELRTIEESSGDAAAVKAAVRKLRQAKQNQLATSDDESPRESELVSLSAG